MRAIEAYAHDLIQDGFSHQDLDTLRDSVYTYLQEGYGELTTKDVLNIGLLQGTFDRLLKYGRQSLQL